MLKNSCSSMNQTETLKVEMSVKNTRKLQVANSLQQVPMARKIKGDKSKIMVDLAPVDASEFDKEIDEMRLASARKKLQSQVYNYNVGHDRHQTHDINTNVIEKKELRSGATSAQKTMSNKKNGAYLTQIHSNISRRK